MPYDFAIVGAGIAGVSLAAHLSRQAKVLVLEREFAPCYHATGRSAALYSALYGNESVRALTRASRDFFEHPPAGFCEHPLWSSRGTLYAGAEGDEAAVKRITCSPLSRRMSQREALERVPILRAHAAVHCAYEADAFDIDVNALHAGYLSAARSHGTQLICDAGLTGLAWTGARWRLDTVAGEFSARVIVNASGAWADQTARMAGAHPLGLQPMQRTAMIIAAPDGTDCRHWPAVIAADESYYFKPDAGMLLASPADETPCEPCDAQSNELDIALCIDRIEDRTSLQVKRIVRSWAGLRTFAADCTPIVGYDAKVEGFFWLAGHGGYGLQTAPALSALASALASNQKAPAFIAAEGIDPAVLSPTRFTRP